MILNFYKDSTGWYIDLPSWPFSKKYLEMVCGADTLLEKLSKGKSTIKLFVSAKKVKGNYLSISKKRTDGVFSGAWYMGDSNNLVGNSKNELWLCPVTLWVFKRYPRQFFIRVLEIGQP